MSYSLLDRQLKTHFDNDGDIFPDFDSGRDSISKRIPAGKKLSHFRIRKLSNSSPLSQCDIDSFPKVGLSGLRTWKVNWSYPVFGKIKYALEIYGAPSAEAFSAVKVYETESDWVDFAHQLVKQKRKFKLIIRNDQATFLWRKLKELSSQPVQNVVGVDDVAITAVIAGAIVAVVALSVFGAIFITAIASGYNIKGKFITGADGPTLEIDASNNTNN